LDLSSRTSGSGCRLEQIDPTVFATTDLIALHQVSFIYFGERKIQKSIDQSIEQVSEQQYGISSTCSRLFQNGGRNLRKVGCGRFFSNSK
jgi:hypothetical protein